MPYTLRVSTDNRLRKVLEAERAIMLRQLARENKCRMTLQYLREDSTAAAVILHSHPCTKVRANIGLSLDLFKTALSLAYRMGADLKWANGSRQGILYNENEVRRIMALRGSALAQAPTRILEHHLLSSSVGPHTGLLEKPPSGVSAHATRLLHRALGSNTPLRRRIHAFPPAIILSTPGSSALVESTLCAYLSTFKELEHSDAPIFVFDDSRNSALQMARVIARLKERFVNPIYHIAEQEHDGSPGRKARLRNYLETELSQKAKMDLTDWVREQFKPGLAGTANVAFWYLRGRNIVWLDQDSLPYVVRKVASDFHYETGEGFGPIVENADVFKGAEYIEAAMPPGSIRETVDLLFLADWFLDSRPEESCIRLSESEMPSREDPSFERINGRAPLPMTPVRVCMFHICGHQDYRARVLHYLLLSQRFDTKTTEALLAGNLPFYAVLRCPPPSAIVRSGKTAFGTAIAFSAIQSVQPIPMLSTTIRLVDFSVGLLLQSCGPTSLCWAPSGLLHSRAPETGSGRGALAAYMRNEDLLFPLLDEVRDACRGSQGRESSLRRVSKILATRSQSYHFSRTIAALLYCDAEEGSFRFRKEGERVPALAQYSLDLRRLYGVRSSSERLYAIENLRERLEQICRLELKRYSWQLRFWDLLEDIDPPPAESPGLTGSQ